MKRVLLIVAAAVAAGPVLFAAEEPSQKAYAPGLGEFMTATQLRHAKLWFAGEAKNWKLASYEIDEIKEGLEDAAALHPIHDEIQVADMIKTNTEAPLKALTTSVEAKDSTGFAAAFDKLTAGCNACHAEANHEYIRIQRPTAPPVSNQVFVTESK